MELERPALVGIQASMAAQHAILYSQWPRKELDTQVALNIVEYVVE